MIRLLRFLSGLGMVIYGFSIGEWMFALAGVWLSWMAWLNVGCCSTTCHTSSPQDTQTDTKEIIFQEVKSKS